MPSMVTGLEYLILLGAGAVCLALGVLSAAIGLFRKHK